MEAILSLESSQISQVKDESTTQISLCSIFDKYKAGLAHSNAPFKLVETNCSISDEEGFSDMQKGDKKVRGCYRKYSFEEKMQAVERIQAGQDVRLISKQFGIPRRNLLRWSKNGCERKEGGGRPTDYEMEKLIYQKIRSGELTDEKQIRNFAANFSKTGSFKASKGWFVKFCSRFNFNNKNSNQHKQMANCESIQEINECLN